MRHALREKLKLCQRILMNVQIEEEFAAQEPKAPAGDRRIQSKQKAANEFEFIFSVAAALVVFF